ncbi:hypothetical protein [Delftia acidovorans]|uniref:hypothetical protein n=1 Tax=Delftia acidovorans TaxID=80866 RepID=UPI0012D7E306|nr:hypothetical protein [Delftia acidovorans]
MQVAGMRGLLSEIIAVGALSKHGDTDLMERVREAADTPLPELPSRSCLAQIEEPAQPVAEICSASHDDAQFGERAIKPLRDISGFEYGTPLYAGAAPAAVAPSITESYTLAEIKAKIASHDYNAELLLQHAMRLLEPVAAPAAPAVPAGFALVPIEPTQQMLDAGRWSGAGSVSIQEEWARKEMWSRMLATISPPPAAYTDDLVALVENLAQALSAAAPDNDLAGHALNYLKRNGLQESPLRAAEAAPQAPAAASASEMVAGALFDFLGYLTTLPKASAVTFSSSHEATPAVEHLRTWAGSRNLQLEPADVSGWSNRLAAPAAPAVDAQDAARYRWLRDTSVPPHNFYLSVPDEFKDERYSPREVDAAIDAAIAAQAAAKGAIDD